MADKRKKGEKLMSQCYFCVLRGKTILNISLLVTHEDTDQVSELSAVLHSYSYCPSVNETALTFIFMLYVDHEQHNSLGGR